MKKNSFACLATALLWISASLPYLVLAGETQVMTLTDGWVRAMPPGMKMTAAFGTLANAGEEPLQLVSWHSDAWGEVTLHRTEQVDGVSRMREVGPLILEPGDKLVMEPGSYHLMLMMPGADTSGRETIELAVVSGDGQRFEFEVPVKKR
jgi:copper(I)-binding protein